MEPPKTSITLLNAIANNTDAVRWTEFFTKYEPVMRGFLISQFKTLDHDDIIQETMKSLVQRLPNYHYTPDEKGHFRAYLLGIVKNKARDSYRKKVRINDLHQRAASNEALIGSSNSKEDNKWKMQTMEAAIEQLLADNTINPRYKEIFRHVALMHEPPEEVAALFSVTRGNVDVIKKRMIEKLSALVAAMTRED